MKPIRRILLSAACAALLTCPFIGCDSAVYDNLDDCPQGVRFRFYNQTPCGQENYPAEISGLRIFAFDGEGTLVDEYTADAVSLSADYTLSVPFRHRGRYTFVAWGSSNLSAYHFPARKGRSSLEELFCSLIPHADGHEGHIHFAPPHLYVGAGGTDVDTRDWDERGEVWDTVRFNMLELTNRVNVSVRGLPADGRFAVHVADDNDRYDFAGGILPSERFAYLPPVPVIHDTDTLRASFTLLKLEEHRNPRLIVTDLANRRRIYDQNLTDSLIMNRTNGPVPYRLECDHDFNIRLELEYSAGTWAAVSVTVNDWNVVSRQVDL